MASENEARDSLSPTCTLSFFDCLSAPNPQEEHRRASRRIGIEREMRIMYQQPHLVPPMKLTVFDDLPSTPGLPPPSHISQWMSQGRNLASRASERASLSIRKKPSRPRIGKPQLLRETGHLPRGYRPLELSIYMPQNRLSDLPEFDHVAFTTEGAIQLPPRALLRAKSEEALGQSSKFPTPRKPVSMFEERRSPTRIRQNTSSSIISTSRPPSEYDALHSHPVSMISLPALPSQMYNHPGISVTILSPIQDEVTPRTMSGKIDEATLDFPEVEANTKERAETPMSMKRLLPTPAPAPAPAPLKFTFKSRSYSNNLPRSKSNVTTETQTRTRVAQWLGRSPSSSISSSYSSVTTLSTASGSFAEHRRKKSQFSQPQQQSQEALSNLPNNSNIYTAPPKPLALYTHSRNRTLSDSTMASTVDTVDTNIMSLDDRHSESSVTTSPVVQDVRSRSGTARTVGKPIAAIIAVSEMTGLAVQEVPPPAYAEIDCLTQQELIKEGTVVKELLGGVVRSPGVGIAF